MARILIKTWGCTLNQSDSDSMRALLGKDGHSIADSEAHADLIVLNTCTVKGSTESKILSEMRRLAVGGKPLVVAGCLAVNGESVRKAAPNAPVVGAGSTRRIAEAVRSALAGRKVVFNEFGSKAGIARALTAPVARIPIEEGCVSRCAFCQTKLARPLFFSYPPKEVARMVEMAVAGGAKEIQLTGMDTGAYGLDRGEIDLAGLLGALCEISGDFRIRLGMINPQHVKRMGAGLVDAFRHGRMYKFIHIPVQSGSEKVCREMERQHTVADFEDAVKAFRKEIPDIAIATDVIVGYPTESETDYRLTLAMLGRTRPDVVNLSRFTPRPGTKAKGLKQLKSETIKARTRETNALIKRIAFENAQKFVGRELRAVMLEKGKPGQAKGRDLNYRQVVVEGAGPKKLGTGITVEISRAAYNALFGKIKKG